MEYKFRHDIHANEIVLLAYYIAAINIESTYHSLKKGEYIPFKHIGLADTFQTLKEKDLIEGILKENSEYLEHQKNLDIEVIFGNPPYSTGQRSANDNNPNTSYHVLDERIEATYAAQSNASLMQALYDSYIRAIRWASDRIKTVVLLVLSQMQVLSLDILWMAYANASLKNLAAFIFSIYGGMRGLLENNVRKKVVEFLVKVLEPL